MKISEYLSGLSKAKVFLLCNLAFICGIALASFLPVSGDSWKFWWFAVMGACAVLVILFWKYPLARLIGLAFFCLAFGFWRYDTAIPKVMPDFVAYYNNETVIVTGVVAGEPDRRDNNAKLELSSQNILVGAGLDLPVNERSERPVEGKVLVTTELYPRYEYGDELRVECELEAPEEFDGFAYDRYLARYGFYSVCYYPEITKIGADQGNVFYAAIFRLKNRFYEAFDKGMGEPAASFGRALILGDKKGIGEEEKNAFARSGLSHLAAISGDCISIIAAMAMSLLLGLGLARRYAFYFASAFLLVYVILIGLPASAMRAGLMGFLVLWAMHLGRLNKITNALCFAAALLLVLNPRLLRDDIGFSLSFLAVAGLAYIYTPLSARQADFKIFTREPFKTGAGILIMTLSAQVFTWPIIAYNFSQVSLIAPLSNLLVLWALPFTLAANFGGLFLSVLYVPGAVLFFLPAWLFLSYIISVADFTARLPLSALEIDYIWPGWLVIYYLAAGGTVWYFRKKAKKTSDLALPGRTGVFY